MFIFIILSKYYFIFLHGFAKYRNESATGIHVFPILNTPPSSLPIPSLWGMSQCTSPKHPVSFLLLWTSNFIQ